jgi:uncharacterized Zn finger protein (UPF0148 family)
MKTKPVNLDTRVSQLLELRNTLPEKPLKEIKAIYDKQLSAGLKLRIRPPFKRLLPRALGFVCGLVSAEYQPLALELLLTGEHSTCGVCGVPVWRSRNYCGCPACYTQKTDKDHARARRVETMQEKYGVNFAGQVEEGKEKRVLTNRQKYGVDNPSQSEEVKRKKRDTANKNWGSDHYFSSLKGRKAVETGMLKKHGVVNPGQTERLRKMSGERFSNPGVQAKIRKTNLEKYGFENPLQNEEIFLRARKSAFMRTEYVTREGKTLVLQGSAEPIVASYLERNGARLLDQDPARIPYVGRTGKTHYFHPDFKIWQKGKFALVEVKSTHTLKVDWERNQRKFTAANKYCEELGIAFFVIVPTINGIRVFKNPTMKTLERFLEEIGTRFG